MKIYWIVVIDYGTHRNYQPVHSSRFAADLIANNWRSIAKYRGDNTVKIYVEEKKVW